MRRKDALAAARRVGNDAVVALLETALAAAR